MLQTIIALLYTEGYEVFTRPNELNIVGVRSRDLTPNAFNDTINVIYTDATGWHIHSFAATTDPGLYWLKNPLQVVGTAILKAGQYVDAYAIGLHRGQYPALVQRKPVTVYRDANRDDRLDITGKEQTGLFGINIHRAKEEGATLQVNKFSAGCQVFGSSLDFAKFLSLCEKHRQLYGNTFTYTLLNQPEYLKQAA